ncbi:MULTISPECIES: LysR family transcriptional regulator [unclassified Serratia (in: enterobacteria)]|uniref:LysR family transcriptional regulator n=1 Tax=unclassified Serratia (in: enterobacteria) TaxID=2647522 RepID=UPI000500D31A|nr:MULTISPECIES: LysR family transcriptional regulator [unclassified Serratia (in: enterobacteria)]KFK93161.1 hypothetical protein JV45_17025 [Serratia sp. Ag2]KFK99600.1 hypothetical protein IV04_05425 [Serratia sp. Ag1]
MNTLPKISHLQVFLAIVKNGGFRKAAKLLNVTQPALTHSMNELEKSLGTSLFIRKKQGIHLTKAGKVLDERAQFLIDTYESAINDVKCLSEDEIVQELSLGVSSFSLFSELSSKISDFQIASPEVKIKIVEDDLSILLRMLRAGKLDFIIHPDSEKFINDDLIDEVLFNSKVCILTSIKSPLNNTNSVANLNKIKWFLPKSKVDYYNHISNLHKDAMKSNNPIFLRGGIMSLLMTLNSDFITLAPEFIIKNNTLMHGFHEVKLKEPLPDIIYKIVYSRHFPLKSTAKDLLNELIKKCH